MYKHLIAIMATVRKWRGKICLAFIFRVTLVSILVGTQSFITADWTSFYLYFVMKTLTVKQHSKEIVLSLIVILNCPRTIQLSNARPVSQTEESVTISETLSYHRAF